MDAHILETINAHVDKHDRMYVVGDFSLCSLNAIEEYRAQIKCGYTVFLRGNHDHKHADRVLGPMPDIKEISWEGQRIILCHYAMLVWYGHHHGSWHLFGHSHGNLDHPSPVARDVGWDVFGRPVEAGEISAEFRDFSADLQFSA